VILRWSSFSPSLAATASLILVSITALTAQSNHSEIDLPAQAKAKEIAKDWKGAEPLWQKAASANPSNGDYWLGLARTAKSAGDLDVSIEAYKRVFDLGIGFPCESAYKLAGCYAKKGDKERAKEWFRTSMKMGLRDLDSASKGDELVVLKDEPEFRSLLALDGPKLGRDDGWRSDIRFLYQEIKWKGWSPFHVVSEKEFDANVAKLIEEVPHLDDVKIELGLMKLLADVGDGHTSLWGARRQEFAFALPVKFYWFKEGLYIVAAEPNHKDLLGAQVVRLGGKTPSELEDAMRPFLSRDNEQWLKEVIPFRLRSTVFLNAAGLTQDPHSVALQLKKLDESTAEVNLQADMSAPDIWNSLPYPSGWVGLLETTPGQTPMYLRNIQRSYWFEYLPSSRTLYFQYNHVRSDDSEPLDRFADRLSKAVDKNKPNRLVIDLRWNNGGDTLVNDLLLKALLKNPRLSEPGFMYVIAGRRTFSAAMNAASYLKRFFNPIFVGEPTGGKPNAAGDEVPFTLTYSGIVVNVSDVYWAGYWPEDHRTWIAPDIYAPPTFADFLAKRDPAMEAITRKGTGGKRASL